MGRRRGRLGLAFFLVLELELNGRGGACLATTARASTTSIDSLDPTRHGTSQGGQNLADRHVFLLGWIPADDVLSLSGAIRAGLERDWRGLDDYHTMEQYLTWDMAITGTLSTPEYCLYRNIPYLYQEHNYTRNITIPGGVQECLGGPTNSA